MNPRSRWPQALLRCARDPLEGRRRRRRADRAGPVVGALPASAATRVVGGPVVVDGQTLDPRLGLVLAFAQRLRPSAGGRAIAEQRHAIAESSRIAAGRPIAVGSCATSRSTARPVAFERGCSRPWRAARSARWSCSSTAEDGSSGTSTAMTSRAGSAPRYADVARPVGRLPPRARDPFPAPVEDAVASFAWAVDHAGELGRPARARGRRRQRGRQPRGRGRAGRCDSGTARLRRAGAAIPVSTAASPAPSRAVRRGLLPHRRQMDWYWEHYLRTRAPTPPTRGPRRC